MTRSFVVTGGGRGIGRSVVERLLASPDNSVVVLEMDHSATTWTPDHPAADRLFTVLGDAANPTIAGSAADTAESAAPLRGWVNNAASFRDAGLHAAPAEEIIALICANMNPTVVGSATAVRRFLARGEGGSIVNVSSHQASRAVRGALPYATAKAAIEGLTRAMAVDYGPDGIRTNAVALGSIVTERLELLLETQSAEGVDHFRQQLTRLHPLGRPGTVEEVAATVAFLLSDDAGFVNGAVVPVDGGRSALGLDPEAGP